MTQIRATAVLTLLMLITTEGAIAHAADAKADFSKVPGVVIDHRAKSTQHYIGSPTLAVLPSGRYVAAHDIFGPGIKDGVTFVFASDDRGKTWKQIAKLDHQFWSGLFVHGGALYIMGPSGPYGNEVIRRSDDGGKTWTTPTDAAHGLLRKGRYHTAPTPVIEHAGRLWRAMEDGEGPGGWGSHFRAMMFSAPADADLLNADNWTVSNRIARDKSWLGGKFGGWLEGNAVVTPEGHIVDVLRVDYHPDGGKAAIIRISDDGKQASFDPAKGFVDFPGGCKKFVIHYDDKTKKYWSFTNAIMPQDRKHNPGLIRNAVALTCSDDLIHWTIRCVVLYHPDVDAHGFQYLDWQFDGDDLIAVSRTAFDDGLGGAHRQHDANFMTFHRIKNFRDLTPADSVPASHFANKH